MARIELTADEGRAARRSLARFQKEDPAIALTQDMVRLYLALRNSTDSGRVSLSMLKEWQGRLLYEQSLTRTVYMQELAKVPPGTALDPFLVDVSTLQLPPDFNLPVDQAAIVRGAVSHCKSRSLCLSVARCFVLWVQMR